MNDEREPNQDARRSPQTNQPQPPLSLPGAERRRLLLKGVRRGSAVAATAVPLSSFATLQTQKLITMDRHQCSVSGMQSGVHSASPSVSECSGNKPSTWGNGQTPSNWPPSCNPDATCRSLFSRCTLRRNGHAATLWEVVKYFPQDEHAHWVCAWLNANGPLSMNFPYTPTEVVKYYNDRHPTAITFFKSYTERI